MPSLFVPLRNVSSRKDRIARRVRMRLRYFLCSQGGLGFRLRFDPCRLSICAGKSNDAQKRSDALRSLKQRWRSHRFHRALNVRCFPIETSIRIGNSQESIARILDLQWLQYGACINQRLKEVSRNSPAMNHSCSKLCRAFEFHCFECLALNGRFWMPKQVGDAHRISQRGMNLLRLLWEDAHTLDSILIYIHSLDQQVFYFVEANNIITT